MCGGGQRAEFPVLTKEPVDVDVNVDHAGHQRRITEIVVERGHLWRSRLDGSDTVSFDSNNAVQNDAASAVQHARGMYRNRRRRIASASAATLAANTLRTSPRNPGFGTTRKSYSDDDEERN